ncbi:hypothetical protein STEG23_026331 [Scotinomys teguina]
MIPYLIHGIPLQPPQRPLSKNQRSAAQRPPCPAATHLTQHRRELCARPVGAATSAHNAKESRMEKFQTTSGNRQRSNTRMTRTFDLSRPLYFRCLLEFRQDLSTPRRMMRMPTNTFETESLPTVIMPDQVLPVSLETAVAVSICSGR